MPAAAVAPTTTVVMGTAEQTLAAMQPGEVTGHGLIPLSETVDQTSKLQVKLLSKDQLDAAAKRYYDAERGDPPEDEAPTKEQLTALFAAVWTLVTIYADFALWVPHWRRLAKRLKFTATIINEWGERVVVEIMGPGSFELWESSWNVFRTACVMLICL